MEDPFPSHDLELRKSDWRIVKLLLKNSKRTVSEIAKAIGFSTRTVARRLEVMMERNTFFLSPVVDVRKVNGFLYHFIISIPNQAAKPAIDEKLRQSISRIVFADTSAQHYSIIATICQNISEAEEICDLMKNTEGVEEVMATVFEDIIFVYEWISNEIERRIEIQ